MRKELRPGDRVSDGAGTFGTVLRVVKPDISPYASASAKEEIYVMWGIFDLDDAPYTKS